MEKKQVSFISIGNIHVYAIFSKLCYYIQEKRFFFRYNWLSVFGFFLLSGFSFTDTDNSQGSRGREGTIFYSTLPFSSAHEHSDIYLQLCMWGEVDEQYNIPNSGHAFCEKWWHHVNVSVTTWRPLRFLTILIYSDDLG